MSQNGTTAPDETAQPSPSPAVPVSTEDREFWLNFRQGLLRQVDSIEIFVLGIRPTTAEIRRLYRDMLKEKDPSGAAGRRYP